MVHDIPVKSVLLHSSKFDSFPKHSTLENSRMRSPSRNVSALMAMAPILRERGGSVRQRGREGWEVREGGGGESKGSGKGGEGEREGNTCIISSVATQKMILTIRREPQLPAHH